MFKKSLMFVLASVMSGSSVVYAASITNYNEDSVTIVLNEDGKESDIVLEGQQTRRDICMNGCSVTLPNGDVYNITGEDIVTLDDGVLLKEPQAEQGSGEEQYAPDDSESDHDQQTDQN